MSKSKSINSKTFKILRLATTSFQYYKKIIKEWMEQWNISTVSPITSTFCYNMEILLVACIDRHLMKLIDESDASPPKIEMVTQIDT